MFSLGQVAWVLSKRLSLFSDLFYGYKLRPSWTIFMIKYPVLSVCGHSLIQSKPDEKKFFFLDVEPFHSISFALGAYVFKQFHFVNRRHCI